MTMTQPNTLNPHPPEFDPFLYASVGEDRNGYAVTVLSTLARLGLDPWKETAELVALGQDAARARLATLLAPFRDVPTLAKDHARVARDLSRLLPAARRAGTTRRDASMVADQRPGKSGAIWAALAIIFVLLQILGFGGSGSGE